MAEPLAPLKASGALYRPCYVEIAFFVSILFDIGPNIPHTLPFTVLFGVVFLRNFYLRWGQLTIVAKFKHGLRWLLSTCDCSQVARSLGDQQP